MKNILLGTSALVGAALVAGAALAEDPKVLIGGVIDFQAGYTSQDADAGLREQAFRNDTEINVSVEGKSDNGLGYGAVIDLEADVSGAARNQGFNAARTYTFLEGGFGRVELGSVEGAAQTIQVDAATIARGTGGIAGDYDMFIGNNTGFANISRGQLPGYHSDVTRLGGDDSTDNAAKVTYYSPRFSGFQVGVSYTPNLADRGATPARARGADFGNVFDLGVGYEGQFDQVGVKAAFAYERGQGSQFTGNDLRAWNLGASVNFAGFSVAGSYGDWDNAFAPGSESDYWTAGLAYDFGPFGASATYIDSTVDFGAGVENKFDNLVLSADYALAPGLTPYVEVSFFDASNDVAVSNDGTVALVGAQLAF
jgi:outer membrane protein OmpU